MDGPGLDFWTWERTPEVPPESGGFGDLPVFRHWNRKNLIRLGEKAVYGGIVVGIVGAVVGVAGVVGNRSVGSDLLLDPFPIRQARLCAREISFEVHRPSFPSAKRTGTKSPLRSGRVMYIPRIRHFRPLRPAQRPGISLPLLFVAGM